MFTIEIQDYQQSSQIVTRTDLPLQYCYQVAIKGDHYKVTIIDQFDDSVYMQTTNNKTH